MNLEALLATVAPSKWLTRQAIILDWNNGPRTGVCALARPRCDFFFNLSAEPLKADLLAVRLFAISEMPSGGVAQIESLLGALGQPVGPLWVPVWKFPNDAIRCEVESRLDAILVAARPTGLLTATVDWLHFDGCWNADQLPLARNKAPRKA